MHVAVVLLREPKENDNKKTRHTVDLTDQMLYTTTTTKPRAFQQKSGREELAMNPDTIEIYLNDEPSSSESLDMGWNLWLELPTETIIHVFSFLETTVQPPC